MNQKSKRSWASRSATIFARSNAPDARAFAQRAEAVVITRGSRGMALFQPGQRTEHISIVGSDEAADVTGAGDTVIAAFALALAAGATFREAAHLANHAGGIVVMKRGTATVSRVELAGSIAADGDPAKVFGG